MRVHVKAATENSAIQAAALRGATWYEVPVSCIRANVLNTDAGETEETGSVGSLNPERVVYTVEASAVPDHDYKHGQCIKCGQVRGSQGFPGGPG